MASREDADRLLRPAAAGEQHNPVSILIVDIEKEEEPVLIFSRTAYGPLAVEEELAKLESDAATPTYTKEEGWVQRR